MFSFKDFDKPKLLRTALDTIGWRFKVKVGPCERGKCPIHGGTHKSRSFVVNSARGLWFCHVCRIGGDGIDLLCRVSRLTFAQSVFELHRRAGIPIPQHEE